MSRTFSSKLTLLALSLTFVPLYAQETAPVVVTPPAQTVPQQPATVPPTVPAQQPEAQTPANPPADQDPLTLREAQSKPGRDVTGKEPKDSASKVDEDKPLAADKVHNPVIWHDPGNVASLDLLHGQGGEKHAPKPPFTFISEDKSGTNPKFNVNDADGKKWRVKLGEESRPEVVASRLLWAMGYYANDDYLLPEADVANLKMSRGNIKGTHITDARFARKPGGTNKIAIWEWKNNPFYGKREFNGLRVMMAVMNNWDLKDINNAVWYDKNNDQQIFLVSDVGATFATNSLKTSRSKDKGNVESFKNSKFITQTTASTVSFGTPSAPTGIMIKTLGIRAPEYARRKGFDWIGRDIPIEDARWIGGYLSQLTHEQLVDAFRAGNFPRDEVDTYVEIVQNRIAELKHL